MRDGKIAIEIDLKKVLIAACMVLSTVLVCKIGAGETLLIVIPGGIAALLSNE